MHPRLEQRLSHGFETALGLWPRPRPAAERLAAARIVSHRGVRDGVHVQENTLAAFDPAVAAGVAALEFDVRFSRDDEPVVVHDPDLQRVFGLPDRIDQTTWAALHRRAPALVHLRDFLGRYADRAHLMLELKTRGTARAEQRLADCLAPLRPGAGFHVLSMKTELFPMLAQLPATCFLPVAKLNLRTIFDWALAHDCAGLAGPFALLRARQIKALRAARGFVGCGFVDRPATLQREIARGVDWIFTNHALRLQYALNALRAGC